jgi:NAD(P)-dependent dehydrogenase (short-subunit alcohol dehydrogenase family)
VLVSTICPGVIDTGIIAATRFAGGGMHAGLDSETIRGKVQALYKKRNYGPEKVAQAVVRAIKRGTPVVPVSPEAWGLYYLKRFAPNLAPMVGRAMAKAGLA